MWRIFWGFCRNWFLKDPLHYLSSHSDFGFKFEEIFVIEKRLSDLASLGVGDSPTRLVGELSNLACTGAVKAPLAILSNVGQ
jgi:hypothetical protein